jgi:hypothetical protein
MVITSVMLVVRRSMVLVAPLGAVKEVDGCYY